MNTGVAGGISGASLIGATQAQRGTAVDSVNTNLGSLVQRVHVVTLLAQRVADGLTGAQPPSPAQEAGPRAVALSTQDHVRDMETALDRLCEQVNRLG